MKKTTTSDKRNIKSDGIYILNINLTELDGRG
jgi:hypothetical protein